MKPGSDSVTGDDPQDETESRPDLTLLTDMFRGPVDIRSLALTGLFVLATLYTMRVARTFLEPVIAAVLLNLLLSPVVGALTRWRIPRALAAAVVLLSLGGVLGLGLYTIWEPANEWLGQAPRQVARVERKVRAAIKPVEQMGEAAAQVEKLTQVGRAPESGLKVSDGDSLGESIFAGTQTFLGAAAVVLALLYFLLATEDLFLRKLVRVLPRLEDKKRAVEIARQIQRDVSIHLATITLINVALGLAVWGVMHLLGMPNPLLWGVMCTALNFVPYLGAAIGTLIVGAVAFLTYDTIPQALVPPFAYFLVTAIEGSVVTPAVLGKRLSLNPIVVFLGIFFWGWIWGIPGSLLAVPMLLVLKTCCDHMPPLAAIGEFLGR